MIYLINIELKMPTKNILKKAYKELLEQDIIPEITIKCKHHKNVKTKILWFYREIVAFKPLYNNDFMKGQIILDESDYLSIKSAKLLVKYIETEEFNIFKRDTGITIKYIEICALFKFLEKYLLTKLFTKLNKQIIQYANFVCFKNNDELLCKMMLQFNKLKIEKIDNLLYIQLIDQYIDTINNKDLRNIFWTCCEHYNKNTINKVCVDICMYNFN